MGLAPQPPYVLGYEAAVPGTQMQQLLQQQQQQQAQQQRMAVQQQQQHWWAQQQQQAVRQMGTEDLSVMLSLSGAQLVAVSHILQDLTKMTGVQAFLTAGSDGSVQLTLTGRSMEVQAARSVAGMMLSKLGVDEPLLPAMPGMPAVPRHST